MSKTLLQKDQGTALLRKLATDDGFRADFENDPVAAMATIGIGADDVAKLDRACSQRQKLAAKEHFARLLDDVDSVQFQAAMSMTVQEAQTK